MSRTRLLHILSILETETNVSCGLTLQEICRILFERYPEEACSEQRVREDISVLQALSEEKLMAFELKHEAGPHNQRRYKLYHPTFGLNEARMVFDSISISQFLSQSQKNGKFDTTIKGLVYEEEDNINIIYDTDHYTLPNMQDLELVLSATRDDEQIPIKPLVETIQKYACSLSGTERARCQIILDEINQYGMQVSRKELRHILNLKSNLGKQINQFIFEESGVLIGNALKSARNKEALFGGVLGIRHFCKDNAQYYYSGYLGKSINRSLPHACRILSIPHEIAHLNRSN